MPERLQNLFIYVHVTYMYIYTTYVHLRWPNNLIGSTPTKTPNQLDEDVLVGFQAIENAHQTRLRRQAIEVFSHQIDALFNRKKPRFDPVLPSRDCRFHISLKIEFSSCMMLFVVDPI